MAVVKTSARRYVGLSGDTKPGSAAGVIVGARFLESDTGTEFEFLGGAEGGAWAEVSPLSRSAAE